MTAWKGTLPYFAFTALLCTVPASSSVAAADTPAAVCNGMAVDLLDVRIDGADPAPAPAPLLRPGQCVHLPAVPGGTYTLRFIERSGQRIALCQRQVQLAPGTSIMIAPDDGAQCLF